MEPKVIVGKSPYLETPLEKVTDLALAAAVATEMVEVAKRYDAVSLSSNQLGYDAAMFIIRNWESYSVYLNPKIVYESSEMALGTETDISFPGLSVKITRPFKIRVRYNDITGAVQTANLEGGTARLFQHEMTHINGTYFWDDANFFNRNKALKDWKNIERKLKRVTNG